MYTCSCNHITDKNPVNLLHVINIINTLVYLYSGIPVNSTVKLASGGTCMELSATRSKVPITPIRGGDHLLNPWGSPLESLLRLVLGDENVSGALIINIVTVRLSIPVILLEEMRTSRC